ncbi:MAG: PDZ domain-containing protein [Fuerstiella sp.]|nr:PDZ domain-containing protein [Fuerstiella sp.]
MKFVNLLLMCGVCSIPVSGGIRGADDQKMDLNVVLAQLNSSDFAVRESAQVRLREITKDQVALLAGHAVAQPAAETAIRCVHALEHHFLSKDTTVSWTAWEGLESLLGSERHLVREEAAWVLSSHWEIRGNLTIEELRRHGVSVLLPEVASAAQAVHARRRIKQGKRPLNALPGGFFNNQVSAPESVQVFFTDKWHGDVSTVRLLRRLPGVEMQNAQGFGAVPGVGRRRFGGLNRNSQAPVVIFLIDGNSLDHDSEMWIKGVFGQRVQERGQVMLGITGSGVAAGAGCHIRSVVPFGSADAAGLMNGDVITAVADQEIAGFDDLVGELRSFAVGHLVEINVNRIVIGNAGRTNITLSIPVKLRSWQDYVHAVKSAADDAESDIVSPATVR